MYVELILCLISIAFSTMLLYTFLMKLKNKAVSVGIWSEDYKKLAKWYQEVLGLPFKQQAQLPNDSYIAFDFGDNWFWIGKHDKIIGNNKDPYRIMVEFYVVSVLETWNELREKGVKIIAEPFEDPTAKNNWCMTIADPEENILQLYGGK
jgi:predicted enzyme related to lactoylglutathione lyase